MLFRSFTSCVSRNVYVQAEACSAERRIPLYFKPQEPSLSSVKKTSIPTGISPAIENGYLSNVYESFKRDSLSNYRIHLGASDQLLNFNAPVFKGLDSISMFSINGRYQYFYGKYKSTSVLFPVLFKIKDLGFNPFVFSFTGDVMDENFNPQVISRLSELKLISEDNPLALKIYFAKGEYTFSADDKQAFLDFMRRNKAENFLIEIEGHTDNQGTADQNLELAKKRAETARQFLLQNGFSDNRIVEISSEHLLGPGTDEDQQKKNRFVQIRLIIKK